MLLIIVSVGCATETNFESHYDDWVGGKALELTKAWGEPTEIISLPKRNLQYSYNLSKDKVLPDTCVVYFEVDSKGVIVAFRHEGNRCKRAPSFV